jgi:hypothetical protein
MDLPQLFESRVNALWLLVTDPSNGLSLGNKPTTRDDIKKALIKYSSFIHLTPKSK